MASDNKGGNPPPYNPYAPQQYSSYGSGAGPQDGSVNINVISPMQVGVPEDQSDGPPSYIEDFEETNVFSDKSIRRGFIRRVYFTLTIQLLATVGIICAFIFWPQLNAWAFQNSWLTYTAMATTGVLMLVLACCGDIRRRVPMNFICLGLFTIAKGVMLGSLCVLFEVEPVLWAMGAAAFVTLGLTLFAVQTKIDFTMCSGMLFALCFSLLGFGLLCGIMRSNYLYIVYACLGTLVFSMYLVFDTQIMLGGNHRYTVDPEEYVFAALNLYLDIITLFLLLLQLISICSD
ncbi:protein lifeguard 1 [Engraulis encrasicolus]|uniref:protein lifeguard 1 n=1 Tax=Engraulis encrasicolus TaxID=184585 RepID=UPI002FD39D35